MTKRRASGPDVRWWLLTTAALLALWLLLSDKRDEIHIAVGAIGAGVIAASVARRGHEPSRRPRWLSLIAYVPWLLWRILLSNLHVARLALSRSPSLQPRFIRRPSPFRDPRALTLLGMSITLTPGTLTVDIGSGETIVHALDDASGADIEEETLARRIAPIFEERLT